jgi:hypothetical protein
MIYLLVLQHAADGIPLAATCRCLALKGGDLLG